MRKKASPTSLAVAPNAGQPASKITAASAVVDPGLSGKCILPFVQHVVAKPKCLSVPAVTVRFIAGIASAKTAVAKLRQLSRIQTPLLSGRGVFI